MLIHYFIDGQCLLLGIILPLMRPERAGLLLAQGIALGIDVCGNLRPVRAKALL